MRLDNRFITWAYSDMDTDLIRAANKAAPGLRYLVNEVRRQAYGELPAQRAVWNTDIDYLKGEWFSLSPVSDPVSPMFEDDFRDVFDPLNQVHHRYCAGQHRVFFPTQVAHAIE